MSHELRTPLNAIVGMSELLLLESEPAHAEPLRLIHEAGIHLNETVSLMLALMAFQGHEDVEEERKVVHLATYLSDRVASIAKPSSGYPCRLTLKVSNMSHVTSMRSVKSLIRLSTMR